MVGVPGKYRGCETCRGRRVRCGNERPICKRCADSHRDCTYERETVFIVASIEDGGRCSSHPPRKTTKKGKAPSKTPDDERLELVAEEPLAPAWSDLVSVSNFGKRYTLQLAALHTQLQTVTRIRDDDSDEGSGTDRRISFAPYEAPNVQPSVSDGDFQMRSRSMVHFSRPEGSPAEGSSRAVPIDGVFLYLYENNYSSPPSAIPPWKDPNAIRQLGPENFRLFPNHHFFVRIYRPNAIATALLNRTPTFLSEPPWLIAPFELHPKSIFDLLLDSMSLLPSLLQRFDRIVLQEQTMARRLQAQDLLTNCVSLQNQFDAWFTSASSSPQGEGAFWISPTDTSSIPFADAFGFRDGLTAVSFIYYWTAQLLFYPAIERLYWTIFEPVVDGPFPQTMPVLPEALQIHPARYARKEAREMAGNVCRSLDFALQRTLQPDILAVPLFVVGRFYQHVGLGDDQAGEGDVFGDGRLELMWCEGFRGRLGIKGRDMQGFAENKKWRDVGAW